MDLCPKGSNNEFVENGLENSVLFNQVTFEWIQILKERKRKGFVLE